MRNRREFIGGLAGGVAGVLVGAARSWMRKLHSPPRR
jgi:hypothetical protein